MIYTLFPTIIIELIVGGVLARHFEVSIPKFIGISIGVNIATQVLLWSALALSTDNYFTVLLTAELVIFLLEGAVFKKFFELDWPKALQMSFGMNATSFGLGMLV